MPDVELLVEVGSKAFEHDRRGRRLLEDRQVKVVRREVVVVVDSLLDVVIARREVSEAAPWNRNQRRFQEAAVCRNRSRYRMALSFYSKDLRHVSRPSRSPLVPLTR